MKNLLFAAAALCVIVLYSCGSSCSTEDLAKDITGLTTFAYATGDTTTAACEEYSERLQSLIDDYNDCDDADIKSAVTVFQGSLDGLPCN